MVSWTNKVSFFLILQYHSRKPDPANAKEISSPYTIEQRHFAEETLSGLDFFHILNKEQCYSTCYLFDAN